MKSYQLYVGIYIESGMKSYQVYTTICMEYGIKLYQVYSSTYNCTDVIFALPRYNNLHRINIVKIKHYCDTNISTLYVQNNYRIAENAWNINHLREWEWCGIKHSQKNSITQERKHPQKYVLWKDLNKRNYSNCSMSALPLIGWSVFLDVEFKELFTVTNNL